MMTTRSDYSCRFLLKTSQDADAERSVISSSYYTKVSAYLHRNLCRDRQTRSVGGTAEDQAGQAAHKVQYVPPVLGCDARQYFSYSHADRKELALTAARTDSAAAGWSTVL